MKYRIKKIKLKNGKKFYVIQKLTRFFWIGPKIWETYQDIYVGNWCFHAGWTWFTRWGDYFSKLNDAISELDEIRDTGTNSPIVEENIVVSYEN